ncbi:antitoxin [Duganella sp. BJB1802]|uniref:antitoxin n=1 Tax=unclassified Duganella TaxID=2636909 RepID=UPI0011C152B4|nr:MULTISPECIES: antitoxin [unclassified Duganella]NVD72850.1 antitoxin [Duganella sp. BJB1802]
MPKEENRSAWMPNPYYANLSREINFRLDFDSIRYFEKLGEPYGLPAEEMIHMYLRHIAGSGYKANLGILTLDEREKLRESLEKEEKLPRTA